MSANEWKVISVAKKRPTKSRATWPLVVIPLLFLQTGCGWGGTSGAGPVAQGGTGQHGSAADLRAMKVATDPPSCTDCGTGDRQGYGKDLHLAGVVCSNGSALDCNVAGTTLLAGSAYVDPAPPKGWIQCAGFINTPGDDVTDSFLDHCLDTKRLRIRVFTSKNELEEDVTVTGMNVVSSWPNFNYLGGTFMVMAKTYWGTTTFFTNTDGKDACMQRAAPSGTVFGTGSADAAIVAGGNKGHDEYRVSCGKADLPDRKIALYR